MGKGGAGDLCTSGAVGFHLEEVISRGQSPGAWREGRGSRSKRRGVVQPETWEGSRGFGLNPNEGSGWVRRGDWLYPALLPEHR